MKLTFQKINPVNFAYKRIQCCKAKLDKRLQQGSWTSS